MPGYYGGRKYYSGSRRYAGYGYKSRVGYPYRQGYAGYPTTFRRNTGYLTRGVRYELLKSLPVQEWKRSDDRDYARSAGSPYIYNKQTWADIRLFDGASFLTNPFVNNAESHLPDFLGKALMRGAPYCEMQIPNCNVVPLEVNVYHYIAKLSSKAVDAVDVIDQAQPYGFGAQFEEPYMTPYDAPQFMRNFKIIKQETFIIPPAGVKIIRHAREDGYGSEASNVSALDFDDSFRSSQHFVQDKTSGMLVSVLGQLCYTRGAIFPPGPPGNYTGNPLAYHLPIRRTWSYKWSVLESGDTQGHWVSDYNDDLTAKTVNDALNVVDASVPA